MIKRDYYSLRNGKINFNQVIDLEMLKKLFLAVYNKLEEDGYFQKYFGFRCTDENKVGELGRDLEAIFFLNLKKSDLYPIHERVAYYSEDDLFDVIEFLHDYSSKGLDRFYHDWMDCGYHYADFKDIEGQKYYREQVNIILKDYREGYEISNQGMILALSEEGLSDLLKADIPTNDIENIEFKVQNAILKFRRYKSSWDDRKESIRELADVMEYLRPQARKYLNKPDESDIFNIANNFGIRHHNSTQKTNYDK